MFFWCETFILKDVHESCWHFCQMQFKCAWEKCAVLIQYLRSDEMLTGLMSVLLFYRYFHNLFWNKKSLTSGITNYHVLSDVILLVARTLL